MNRRTFFRRSIAAAALAVLPMYAPGLGRVRVKSEPGPYSYKANLPVGWNSGVGEYDGSLYVYDGRRAKWIAPDPKTGIVSLEF